MFICTYCKHCRAIQKCCPFRTEQPGAKVSIPEKWVINTKRNQLKYDFSIVNKYTDILYFFCN